MSALAITKEDLTPGGKKLDSNGASGLSQLLTSTNSQGKDDGTGAGGASGAQDSPRGGAAAFGSGPKALHDSGAGGSGAAADDADDDKDELTFGVELPFTVKIYFPIYKPPAAPAAATATPASSVAATAAPATPVKSAVSDSKAAPAASPAPAAASSSSSAASATPAKPKDRLAVEPGLLVVHITEDAKAEKLLALAFQSCFKPNATPDLKALVANSELCPCDERGQRDDECPSLDSARFVHQFGVHHFLVRPLRAAPTTIAQLIASLKPLPTEGVWLGVAPKKGRLLDPNARMFMGAESGRVVVVRRLVEHAFADVHATGIDNWTALHFASRAGHLAVVNYLLKQGVAIDALTKSRWTPLHMAADKGKYDVAEVLLTCGADANIRDASGHTPAYYAAQKNYTELIELLSEFQGVNA